MAAANPLANANLALTLEPHYSGKNDTTCTAERYLRSINSQRETGQWDDARTIAQAKKFLTGSAEVYFLTSLRLSDPTRFALVEANWVEWQKAFKEKFFAIASAGDLTTQWARLHQLPSEDVFEFWIRVTLHIESYMDYFPAAPAPFPALPALPVAAADVAAMQDDIVAAVPVAAGAAAPVIAAAAAQALFQERWDLAVAAGAAAGWRQALSTNAMVLARKVFIAGLRDAEFRNVARRMEADDRNNDAIVNALTARERGQKAMTVDNKPIKPPPKPSLNSVGEVAQSDTAPVSRAATARRQRGRGRGQGRRGQSGRADGPPTSSQTPYPRTEGAKCDFCGFDGHTYAQCMKRQRSLGFDSGMAALSHLTESDGFSGNSMRA